MGVNGDVSGRIKIGNVSDKSARRILRVAELSVSPISAKLSQIYGLKGSPPRRADSQAECLTGGFVRLPDWAEEVLKATDKKGVDLIVDQVSASVANQNMKAAAVLGRIVNVGRLGGFKGEFDYDLHAMKRIDYIGVTFRTRSPEEVREIVRVMRADLWGAVESGKLRLPIDRAFPLDKAADALAHMRANAHFGKIVLVV